ncbi:MAG: NAD-dependent deacetylase [Acidobacteria bacterium]|nr:MAG: NAD-dependent deacetylase [Acidobacteriota bacterium]
MNAINRAAEAVKNAQALIIGAGAGMGVDSGLPDFRGNEGFWQAYPPFAKLGLSFIDLANPAWFGKDPRLAWGFYGHRLNLYRATVPHQGFSILKKWGENTEKGAFIFTSNVDGQFQKAGFQEDQILECHGSIHHLQCTGHCSSCWPADGEIISVNEQTMRAERPLPTCHHCGKIARPNILMFGDWGWDSEREMEQSRSFRQWLHDIQGLRVVLIECGAGSAVPTVRSTMERLTRQLDGQLIRINTREPEVPKGQIGISAGAAETLCQIDSLLLSSN